ncbi:WD repeat and FYVE domain-containing protein 2 isoform X1 [Neophocaena asiaeorientalis asiaeorientalis]|uniref:WD repeat and FYVE domain-containing protein 2 isoform X1 n=2 Tax=Odontoceti TaxID=9722 RepID=A0A341CBH6_NEOAA|nr:WD repeat and FYVE domain-containing protein 2 isoform X1 [Neophocaena asiaeorientalis asiaeorientalis]
MIAGPRRPAPANQSPCLSLCPCPSGLLSSTPRRSWRRRPQCAPSSDGGRDPAQAADPQADPAAAGRGVSGGGEYGRDRAQGRGRHQCLGGQPFLPLHLPSCPEMMSSLSLLVSWRARAVYPASSMGNTLRTVRVWLKRDSGQYWPSIYHVMPSPCSCMSFNPETRRLSIGLDNGTISEFLLSEDYNKMTPVKNYQAHQSRVTMILFVLELEWVLSTGQDKQFAWHCSESGQRLGGYRTSAVASGLQFDVETRHVFIGDHSGQVTILKLEQENCTLVTTFRGHTGGVTALCWDPVQRVLFSGSSDHSVIMWDIGGRKGTAIELQGHSDRVQALSYAQHTRQLISCGGDGGIVVWNMDVERQETPEWLDSDSCQKCDQPFFWNFKQMWDSKKIGLRQHHCRKCGKAVCGKCSSKRSSIPLMGFEFEVRVCDSCHEAITDEERAPTATFHDSKHNIVHVHFDATRGWLLTSGTDKVIKLWDMTPVVS